MRLEDKRTHWLSEYLKSPERKDYERRHFAEHGRFPSVPVPVIWIDEAATITEEEVDQIARIYGTKDGA